MSLPDLSLHTPADLVAAVPYLLGFHPDDGSGVVLVTNDTTVVFLARISLPSSDDLTGEFHNVCRHLASVIGEQDGTGVIMIGYGLSEHVDVPLTLLRDHLATVVADVADLLRVFDGRVFTVDCTHADCCPPEGTPVDLHTSAVAAQATVAGLVALPDRDAVAAQIAPLTGDAGTHMQHATQRARTRLDTLRISSDDLAEEGHDAIRQALADHDIGRCLDDDQVAWLTVLLAEQPILDRALFFTSSDPHRLSFWTDLTRRADGALAAAPTILLALAAWRCGNGPLAVTAIERALAIEPVDPLAVLVAHALQAGITPKLLEHAIQASASAAGVQQ